MFNFSNLSDYEFELLCKHIMTKELKIDKLYTFSKGRGRYWCRDESEDALYFFKGEFFEI